MKYLHYIIIILISFSCNKKPEKNDLKILNGYWEIDYVEFEDGTKKEYKVNEFIDYYQLKGKMGTKQKGKFDLDGKILLVPVKDKLVFKDSIEKIYIKTKSRFSSFTDEIISITDNNWVSKNDNNVIYHFKRYKEIK